MIEIEDLDRRLVRVRHLDHLQILRNLEVANKRNMHLKGSVGKA